MKFLDIGTKSTVYGDGVHDDTKALQECLDELRDGGTLFFPDGTYLLSGALIFYSHQNLIFSDHAVLRRSDKSDPITKYLLASYSEPAWADYDGTHDVTITGGIFDGNEKLTEYMTIVNTVHCKNITIRNCTFIHCAGWHCIEINGTDHAVIENCVFDGPSYTALRPDLSNELIQFDASIHGSYGPVYDYAHNLIDFCSDATVCRNCVVRNCLFKCDGFPGVGHHGNHDHHNIEICNNLFIGRIDRFDHSRGFVIFMEKAHSIHVHDNIFASKSEADSPALGLVINNPSPDAMIAENNVFEGWFAQVFKGGITEKGNEMQ